MYSYMKMLSHFLQSFAIMVAVFVFPAKAVAQELICDLQLYTNNIATENDIFTELQEAVTNYIHDPQISTAQIPTKDPLNWHLILTTPNVTDAKIK